MKVKEAVAANQIQKKRYTYQDYLTLPDDGNSYEIIEGELIMSPAPHTIHQQVSLNVVIELTHFVRNANAGKVFYAPTVVILSKRDIVQPDILFVSRQKTDIIKEKNINGVPDLIIEILSPATGYNDLIEKKELYEKFGVQEYWIVDPKKRRVDVYVHNGEKFESMQRIEKNGVLASQVLKGLEIKCAKIFEDE
ncbi:MAG: Uma2 family endonuclease [candidate division KSB1 bacterium]|nr:Uma2 family endonuclease [candidate division KSB1 bacterium]MDZ7317886.1 Uma2 family endonuclease [candidate division KSB1 bacterium]MDZ7341742.1 Uma2 family endonuclease [candidate division KSB1 bacterium]